MWSFAVLLWELVTREVPFADLSHMEIGMKVSGRKNSSTHRLIMYSQPHLRISWFTAPNIIPSKHPEVFFRFGRLQQLCFSPPPYRSGGSRRPSADHPTGDFTSYLQADEALHERGPSQETQVWHDRPHPGEDARQVNALTAICTLLLLCFFFFLNHRTTRYPQFIHVFAKPL